VGAYEVVRSTSIEAEPARIHPLIDDFRQWPAWSPWEDVDPGLQRTYSGPDSGVGARYAWKGNRKAGEGSMEIIGSSPERIEVDLAFLKPFENRNTVVFELRPSQTASGRSTEVTWRMKGETKGLWALASKVFPMDRLVGKDFEKGLTRLKAVAEKSPA
jgi:hypothetical protein